MSGEVGACYNQEVEEGWEGAVVIGRQSEAGWARDEGSS